MPDQRLHFEHFEIQTNADGSLVKLGRGGMGTTYKAFDMRRRKHVALKIIDDKLLADQTSRRRFFNEARAASNLDHPNVVRVDYVCSDDAEECFYAMEWVDGESLGERVKKSGALPPRKALLLLRAVADALTVLGQQRLVHRDIKPDNIMIARAARREDASPSNTQSPSMKLRTATLRQSRPRPSASPSARGCAGRKSRRLWKGSARAPKEGQSAPGATTRSLLP